MEKHIAVMVFSILSPAFTLGQTTFTYQGQIKTNGVPANGSYNLTFKLFTAADAGSQVGPTITRNGIPVTNGLLNQALDFGPGAFPGDRRWLEVTVNGTVLTPRQEITAAPYAMSVPGLAMTESGVEVSGDIHTPGEVTASAFSSNSPLIFKVNPGNIECARIEDETCYLGLGTDNPQARLHIGGTPGVDGIRFPDGSLQTTAAGVGAGGFWSANGSNIFNNNGGNVGIGTNIPANKLTVRTATLGYGVEHTDGDIRLSTFVGRGTGWLGTLGNHKLSFFANDNGFPHMITTLDTAGRFGIGTDSPLTKLHINHPSESVSHRIETGAGTNGWTRVEFANGDGQWNVGTSRGFNGNQLYFHRQGSPNIAMGIQPNGDAVLQGNLGIGAVTPQAKLHLSDAVNSVSHRIQTGAGTNGWTRVEFANGDGQWNVGTSRNFNGNQFYVHRQGSPSVAFGVQPNGDAFVQGTMTCKVLAVTGADVAEKFPSSDGEVQPGTVMEIDPDQPGKLRIAREAYSTRVAGVVSGAGDNPAGAILGNFPGSENAPAIALSGRVWVHCDATTATIAPGDLLTTSAHPGFAMKASDREKSHGAVLGKAMTSLTYGERGLVLVLVNLQ